MAARRAPTNGNIRDLLEDLRLEMKSDIKDVATQVAALDKTVQENALKQAVSSTKVGMLITAITLVVSAATTFLINRIVR